MWSTMVSASQIFLPVEASSACSRPSVEATYTLALPHRDAPVDEIAARLPSGERRRLGIVAPQFLARGRIERVDVTPGSRGVHDTVDDGRRRFLSALRSAEIVGPGEAQLADVRGGDGRQRRVIRAALVASAGEPVLRLPIGGREARLVDGAAAWGMSSMRWERAARRPRRGRRAASRSPNLCNRTGSPRARKRRRPGRFLARQFSLRISRYRGELSGHPERGVLGRRRDRRIRTPSCSRAESTRRGAALPAPVRRSRRRRASRSDAVWSRAHRSRGSEARPGSAPARYRRSTGS